MGQPALATLGLAGEESPIEAARLLLDALPAALGLEALALAAVAVAIPLVRGLWQVAGLGACMLAAVLLIAPGAPAMPLVAAVWLTCGWLVYAESRGARE